MSENQQTTYSTEERLLAALAHGSIVANGLGILVGMVIYLLKREDSPYAARQALQASVFQLFSVILVVVMWIIWSVFYTLSMIPLLQLPDTAAPPPIFWIGMASMVIPIGFMIMVGIIGLVGALRVWQGHDFRYPLVGNWLARLSL